MEMIILSWPHTFVHSTISWYIRHSPWCVTLSTMADNAESCPDIFIPVQGYRLTWFTLSLFLCLFDVPPNLQSLTFYDNFYVQLWINLLGAQSIAGVSIDIDIKFKSSSSSPFIEIWMSVKLSSFMMSKM